jgi:hypothetical protein
MRRVMVRYRVKPEHAARNTELVRAVYDELREREPDGIRYATFTLEDGVTFVHIAEVDGDANPLAGLAAFRAFQEGVAERCDEPPAASQLREVDSFRLFDR